jgi:hypothetical protein
MTNLKTKEMKVIPGKFEEPANLEMVAREARDWFLKHLECGAASSVSTSPGVRNR